MTPFRRKKWKRLYISSLTVIYLVFFTAQLSYKFHIYANFPLFGPFDNGTENKLITAFDPKVPNFDHKFHLTVDKRYDLKHVFALVTPAIHIDRWNFADRRPLFLFTTGHDQAATSQNSLRGPPVV